MGYIVREASDPRTQRVLTPAPVEYLWRNKGLIHELVVSSIDSYGFMSRVSLGQSLCARPCRSDFCELVCFQELMEQGCEFLLPRTDQFAGNISSDKA